MYKKLKATKSSITRKDISFVGESIENKVYRITNNKEPIKDGAPIIYTERKEGVLPQYDIRADRFEVAIEAKDMSQKSHIASREYRAGMATYDTMSQSEQQEFNKKFPNNKFAQAQNKAGGQSTQGEQ